MKFVKKSTLNNVDTVLHTVKIDNIKKTNINLMKTYC
jgi:hypothetical protein